jgi:RNA polymerase sigma-70 factor (ECF subfamily)
MEIGSNFSDKAIRDFRLIKNAKNGDQKAYAELLGYYKDSLFFMLIKMVKSKEDAEDLTIEAFEKAFRNLASYSSSFAFSTWLFKIATNHGIDFLRTQKKRKKEVYIDSQDSNSDFNASYSMPIIEESNNPEEIIVQEQKEELLKSIIKRMSPDYRRILTMRYFEEYSYTEISEKLDIPIGTVKARLFRSRELLLSIMKKHNINKDRL